MRQKSLAGTHVPQRKTHPVSQSQRGGEVSGSGLISHVLQQGVRLSAIGAMALASALPMKAQTAFNFSADRSGTVAAPVYGLAATDSDYLLVHSGDTSKLPLNFTGNGQETPIFTNPFTPVKDAASLNNDYMFQLDSSGNIRQVNTLTGNTNSSFGVLSTGTSNTFGIGYDASTNRLGVGQYDGSDMTFKLYDVSNISSGPLSTNTFAFDSSLYGTPTGLDHARVGNSDRMFVGTMDKFDDGEFLNFVLDLGLDGFNDPWQYATISGNTNKLQDVNYLDGKLALAFQSGTEGGIQVMDNFAAIPEPRFFAFIICIFTLSIVLRKKLKIVSSNFES